MPAHNAGEGAGGAQSSLPFAALARPDRALRRHYVLTDGNGQYVALLCCDTGVLTRLKVTEA